MESEVAGTPLMAEGGGSARTLVLERPAVEVGVSGPTLVVPPVASPGSESPVAPPASANPNPRIWDVLTAWREAARSIAAIEPDSTGWYARHAELVGLRALYHTLFEEAAAAADAPRRLVLVGRPQPAGDEGLAVAVVEDSSAGGATNHDPGA